MTDFSDARQWEIGSYVPEQYAVVAKVVVFIIRRWLVRLQSTEKLKSYMQRQWSLVGGMADTFREME